MNVDVPEFIWNAVIQMLIIACKNQLLTIANRLTASLGYRTNAIRLATNP